MVRQRSCRTNFFCRDTKFCVSTAPPRGCHSIRRLASDIVHSRGNRSVSRLFPVPVGANHHSSDKPHSPDNRVRSTVWTRAAFCYRTCAACPYGAKNWAKNVSPLQKNKPLSYFGSAAALPNPIFCLGFGPLMALSGTIKGFKAMNALKGLKAAAVRFISQSQ